MKTITTKSTQYRAPKCEIFACESMTPLCGSGVMDGFGTAESFDETNYEWQLN